MKRREHARVAAPIGAHHLSDAEMVALAAGVTEAKAVALLEYVGGLKGLYHAGRGEIAEKIGLAGTARLLGSRDLCQRLEQAVTVERDRLADPGEVFKWARHNLARLDQEQLWVLCLDGRHGLITAKQVAEGGVHGLHVGVRDVLRAVLREGSSAFIMLHVHPSGDPTPSDEDVQFTKALIEGTKKIGTPLLDHVIVVKTRYKSMSELGLL